MPNKTWGLCKGLMWARVCVGQRALLWLCFGLLDYATLASGISAASWIDMDISL